MPHTTQDTTKRKISFAYWTITVFGLALPASSATYFLYSIAFKQVVLQPRCINTAVWADPFSLAATNGLSVISFPPGT